MHNPNPVYVASDYDRQTRQIVLESEQARCRGRLDVAIKNNEDGSLTFFVNILGSYLSGLERELARPVYIVEALDPNLVEV